MIQMQAMGFDEAIRRLQQLPPGIQREVSLSMVAIDNGVIDQVSAYPPETQANMPPGMPNPRTGKPYGRWYVRGVGTVYKSGRIDRTSEALGKHWTSQVSSSPGQVIGIIGNPTSYGPFVQDRERQASFHRARGWRTVQDVIVLLRDKIIEELQNAVRRAIGGP